MAIKEKWIPSQFYSTSRAAYNKAVIHTTEGAQTIESLGSWFQNPGAQCSSHHGADNKQRGVFGAYVYENNVAWTQGNANGYCVSIELCTPSGAAANWSRSTWLGAQETLTRNAAEWLAYVCGKYNIPLVALSASQAQNAGTKGVCQHRDLGSWGSGHSDCGNGFPMDQVIAWAKAGGGGGGGTTPPPEQEMLDVSASVTYDSKGGKWYAAIGSVDGGVFYQKPGTGWLRCDNSQKGAKSGAGIAINPGNGEVVIVYTNGSNDGCTYTLPPGAKDFVWGSIGGKIK
jgi:N-acetylmuramoyl-L-alanine amidase